MLRLFDSVAPDVNIISLGEAPMRFATCDLAASTADSDSHP